MLKDETVVLKDENVVMKDDIAVLVDRIRELEKCERGLLLKVSDLQGKHEVLTKSYTVLKAESKLALKAKSSAALRAAVDVTLWKDRYADAVDGKNDRPKTCVEIRGMQHNGRTDNSATDYTACLLDMDTVIRNGIVKIGALLLKVHPDDVRLFYDQQCKVAAYDRDELVKALKPAKIYPRIGDMS